MSSTNRQQALEAVLFVADEPLDEATLSRVLEVGLDEIATLLRQLQAQLEAEERGLLLTEAAGGWRLYTAPAVAEAVERYVLDGRTGRLSQAALETLAVVAYKQPVARQDIADIRGVNPDGALRTLVSRDLVEEVGRDPGPGQAILYGTTRGFLEKLGLRDIGELPPLAEFLADTPAPDEPLPGDLREARRRIAAGEELPATGRGRWAPDARPHADEAEIARLTDALDQAARSASKRLREAMAATEDPTDEADSDAAGADDASAPDGGKTEADHPAGTAEHDDAAGERPS
ncbi:MAG: SMC-Scp complex subunit ScpB [Actinobacteria bacterium]|nr:SMC-Scp complex subunit ScpB [Actinomycetota bacterium]